MPYDAIVPLRLGRAAQEVLDADARELLAAIADARAEYRRALSYFQSVSQPELVEHAILLLSAAERRHAYLLHQARELGIRLPWSRPPGEL